jgi:short-subunit dehydrogenase
MHAVASPDIANARANGFAGSGDEVSLVRRYQDLVREGALMAETDHRLVIADLS